jgi:hypothetical protein
VNCDDWTDPPLREATTLECYRRSHKIALAELDAANRAYPTRRLKTRFWVDYIANMSGFEFQL